MLMLRTAAAAAHETSINKPLRVEHRTDSIMMSYAPYRHNVRLRFTSIPVMTSQAELNFIQVTVRVTCFFS